MYRSTTSAAQIPFPDRRNNYHYRYCCNWCLMLESFSRKVAISCLASCRATYVSRLHILTPRGVFVLPQSEKSKMLFAVGLRIPPKKTVFDCLHLLRFSSLLLPLPQIPSFLLSLPVNIFFQEKIFASRWIWRNLPLTLIPIPYPSRRHLGYQLHQYYWRGL